MAEGPLAVVWVASAVSGADSHLKEAGPPAECPTSDKGQHLVIGFLYNDIPSEIVKIFF